MNNKTKWTLGFLGVTAVAFILELIASFDKSSDTQSWTLLITRNIPAVITFPVLGVIIFWLIFHFKKYYKIDKENK
ncbi:MAG: hypothetical protein PHS54_02885 [Clostridia bacterium]|nr:hypothetical protein [Clostridia bacterium]